MTNERVRKLCDGEELVVYDGQDSPLEPSPVESPRTALVEVRNRLAERQPAPGPRPSPPTSAATPLR